MGMFYTGLPMADDADRAGEREEIELAAHIENARRVIPIHERPILDCVDCSDMTQTRAKTHCGDYAACLSDWEKSRRLLTIKGNE